MANNILIEESDSKDLLDKVKTNNLAGKEPEIDIENIKIPYVIKNKILMSPGVWNNYYYSNKAISDAYLKTRWDEKQNRSLFLDHLDQSTKEWIGEIINPRMEGEDLMGDLVIVDKPTAQKLAYGAKMGISPKVHGEQEDNKMLSFLYDNFSVVINPAVKTAYINNMEVKMAEEKEKVEDVPKEPATTEEVKTEEPVAEEVKTEEPAVEEPAKEEPVVAEEPAKEEPVETQMSETDEILSAVEEANADLGGILKKAKEIRKEGESWKDAVKRASASMAEEKPKKEKEEPAKEEPKPEVKMADIDVVNQIVKLAQMLAVKKELPVPEVPEVEKKKEEQPKAEKMSEDTEKMISELSEKVTDLTKKLNEPDKISQKGEQILSETDQEKKVEQNLDEAFLNVLKDIN